MMIETTGLRKSFRSRQGRELKTVEAVRGVDLTVAEDEIFGFLGPNGESWILLTSLPWSTLRCAWSGGVFAIQGA